MASYLIGGTLIDGTGRKPLSDTVVGFEEKLITYVGKKEKVDVKIKQEETVIDVKGKRLIPGLINMHEHLVFKYAYGPPMEHVRKSPTFLALFAIRNILENLRNGITTIREMGSTYGIALALRDAINSGELIGPRVIACNQPICSTGGHASELCMETDGPDGFRRAARIQLKIGADFIKLMEGFEE